MPHLDHMETHVISAILNIAQQVQLLSFRNPRVSHLLLGEGTMAASNFGPRWQAAQHLPEAW